MNTVAIATVPKSWGVNILASTAVTTSPTTTHEYFARLTYHTPDIKLFLRLPILL